MLSLEPTCACSNFVIVLQLASQLRLQARRLEGPTKTMSLAALTCSLDAGVRKGAQPERERPILDLQHQEQQRRRHDSGGPRGAQERLDDHRAGAAAPHPQVCLGLCHTDVA